MLFILQVLAVSLHYIITVFWGLTGCGVAGLLESGPVTVPGFRNVIYMQALAFGCVCFLLPNPFHHLDVTQGVDDTAT